MNYKVKTAKGIIKWYMNLCGFKGWTSFWKTIYVLPGYENNEQLLKHEKCHLKQIEDDGIIIFSLVYIYWTLQYGYYNNPYEVEARQAETKP